MGTEEVDEGARSRRGVLGGRGGTKSDTKLLVQVGGGEAREQGGGATRGKAKKRWWGK